MGQDGKEREGRDAGLTQARREVASPGGADPADGARPAGLPEEFRSEIRAALRYERGLAIKASIAVALVVLVVAIRMLYLG